MPDDDTLLAYLVPKLTSGVEDAATDALAYILNKSEACRDALVALVTDDEFSLDPVVRVRTQAVRDDKSRLDLVGYDSDGSERIIVESKFGATLLDGQASGYLQHLDEAKSGVLLFVAPEPRRATLWAEICSQMQKDGEHSSLQDAGVDERLRVARVGDTDKRVALTSWVCVLEVLKGAASELSLVSEIEQLAGLALRQGDTRFRPLHPQDLSSSVAHRIHDLYQILNDLVDAHGVHEGWMDVKRLKAAGGWDGYGRNFRFSRVEGQHWIGVSYSMWGDEDGTPIWLYLDEEISKKIDQEALRCQLALPDQWVPEVPLWVPIRLRMSATYDDVLEDVVGQVQAVQEIALSSS